MRPVMLLAAAMLILGAASVSGLSTNPNTNWLNVAQAVVRVEGIPNQISARVYAFVSLGQLTALRTYRNAKVQPKTTDEAVLNVAGHSVLSALYPWRQSPVFDGILKRQLANLTHAEKAVARSIGSAAAASTLKGRFGDTSTSWCDFDPAPAGNTYEYQFTPATSASNVSAQQFALYPQTGQSKPFISSTPFLRQLEKEYNYKDTYGSPEYLADLNTTYYFGNLTSSVRTSKYDRETPAFWADGANTSAIGGHWLNISYLVLPELSLDDSTLFFARFGAALWDSAILDWRLKYSILHWRPITAFRAGAPNFLPADPYWTPYLATPPHPEYPSGHQATVGAALGILKRQLGTDLATFTIGTEGANLEPRTYTNLTTAGEEVGWSRILGGIHFPAAGRDGLDHGIKVANHVWDRLKF